jgi:aerobic-type carbon monoxide dehydrogenase small subunit (CoxS/CutS family)
LKKLLKLTVNGGDYEVFTDTWKTLVRVLRDDLGLSGTKEGCNTGNCGVCTVLINGKAVKSCMVLAFQASGKDIMTIEGLGANGLDPLQQAFIDHFAVQCGFCTPGMILSAKSLLNEKQCLTEDDVKHGLAGNLCRCTGYVKIIEAVLAAAEKEGKGE